MALDTSLYKLIKDAPTIISDAYSKLAEIASAAIDSEGNQRQPRLHNQLINIGILYDQVTTCVTLNEGGTTVTAIVGEDVDVVNALLVQLKKLTAMNL